MTPLLALKAWFLRMFCGFSWKDVQIVEDDEHGNSVERTVTLLMRNARSE